MKNQLGCDAHAARVSQEDLKDLFRAFCFYGQLAQDLFDGGNGEAGGRERFLDLLFGASFLRIEADGCACALDDFAMSLKLLLRQQLIERGSKGFFPNAPSEAGPQVLSRYSGKQRIFFVEFLDSCGDLL